MRSEEHLRQKVERLRRLDEIRPYYAGYIDALDWVLEGGDSE